MTLVSDSHPTGLAAALIEPHRAAFTRRARWHAVACGAVLLLAACGSSDAPEPAEPAATGERVTTAACSVFNPQDCTLPPPGISGLTDATVGLGQGVVFSALTSGFAPVAHQWSRRAAGSQTFVSLPATGPSYTLPVTTLANNGDVYRLRVTDRFGRCAWCRAGGRHCPAAACCAGLRGHCSNRHWPCAACRAWRCSAAAAVATWSTCCASTVCSG